MEKTRGRILIAEDDHLFARELAEALEAEGYEAIWVRDGHEALRILAEETVDLCLVDLSMPGMDGLQLMKKASESGSEVPMVVITGHASIDRAIQATRLGAFDFFEKPIDLDRVLLTIERGLEKRRLQQGNRWMAAELMSRYRMVGSSAAMRHVYYLIDRIAATGSTVMISGETGTGKELVAMAIHLQSPRSPGPFVSVNCAAIPETLIESELFGHRKGAFTGATEDYRGKFALAGGGTLLLDEIGDLSLAAQAKLLRVLQSHVVEMVGDSQPRKVDVRIIAATNKELLEQIAKSLFRPDLYYRICVTRIDLPPLRDHKEDIPELAELFLGEFCQLHNRVTRGFSRAAMRALIEYDWPGNIRQLRNVVENAVILCPDRLISPVDLSLHPLDSQTSAWPSGLFEKRYEEARAAALKQFQDLYVRQVLQRNGGNISKAAAAAGMARSSLHRMLRGKAQPADGELPDPE